MPEITNTSSLMAQNFTDPFPEDKDKETVIGVYNVSMIFNMASERLNSLKEYAIKIAKRELFFEAFTALDNISFEVKKGDVFGILGTNGSGKSTLLKIIAGVLDPSSGSCKIKGNISPLIELGAGFDQELSARENIYLNGALLGYSKEFINEHFDEIVSFAEIEKFLDMPLKNYSSGMVARIAFAIATIMIPDVLIVDEVLAVGDFMFQKKCEDRISDIINKHGVTVLIVSHSNDQIERLCNKAVWIEKGHMRMIGSASEVCNAYRVLGGRIGSSESEKIVFDVLQQADALEEQETTTQRICGENHLETAAQAVLESWEDEQPQAVVLTPDTTHVFSILASGIAGATKSPILLIKENAVPSSTEHALFKLKPKQIYILAPEETIGLIAPHVCKIVPEGILTPLPIGGSPEELSRQTIQHGLNLNIWHNSNTALFVSFKDNSPSFSAAPFMYNFACPTVVTSDDKIESIEDCIHLIKQADIKNLVFIGTLAKSPAAIKCRKAGFDVLDLGSPDVKETCSLVFRWVEKALPNNNQTFCIASQELKAWPNLLAIAPYASRNSATLLLEDTTDLDNVAACLGILQHAHPKKVIIFGDDLTMYDQRLIEAASKQQI